jgi:hypothetical protein
MAHRGSGSPDDRRRKNAVDKYFVSLFAKLIERFKSVQEGNGTMRDNSCVLWANNMGNGGAHNNDRLPWLMAGSCGGAFRTGRYLKQDGGLDPNVGVYAVATVQEEIGLRGARTSSFAIAPQSGLAVDVNHAIDYPGLSKSRYGQLDVGKGPSVMRGANANPVVFRMLCESAEEQGIPFQVDVAAGGTGTDGNAMQLNREGMAVGILGVALRYMHTPCEVLSLTDVDNCARLMAAYCRRVRKDSDFTPHVMPW